MNKVAGEFRFISTVTNYIWSCAKCNLTLLFQQRAKCLIEWGASRLLILWGKKDRQDSFETPTVCQDELGLKSDLENGRNECEVSLATVNVEWANKNE